MLDLVNIPETVTPWLVLISTAIGTLGVVGTALFWLRRKIAAAFVVAVNESIEPLAKEVRSISTIVHRELQADHGFSMKDRVLETLGMAKKTAEDLPVQIKKVEDKLNSRSKITDGKFESLERRLSALEVRQSRDTQKVVEAVQGTAPPSSA